MGGAALRAKGPEAGLAAAAASALALGALALLAWQLPKSAYSPALAALVLGGGLAGAFVLWRSDPAITFALAFGLSVFASHWDRLGPSLPLGLNRILLALGGTALLLRARAACDRPPVRLEPVHLWLGLALAGAISSAALAGTLSDSQALFTLLDRFGLIPFAVFVLAPYAFPDARRRSMLAWTLVAMGAYLGVVTLLEAAGMKQYVYPRYIADASVGIHAGRARGPFADAAANGFALFACTVGCAIAFGTTRPPIARLIALGVGVLCSAGLIFTLQRQVWLAAVVAALVVTIGARELRRYIAPLVAAALLLVASVLAVVPGLADRVEQRRSAERSLWDRQNSNAAALRMVAERPLSGFGWHRFDEERHAWFWQAEDIPLTTAGDVVHNVYLSNAVELGLPLTMLWFVAIAAALGTAVLRRGPPDLRPWKLGAAAVIVFWCVAALFGPMLHAFPNLCVWLLAGVATGLSARQRAA